MCVCVCVCVCVRVCIVVIAGPDGCIPLTMLVDVCQCCRLLIFVCLPPFETLSLLLNLVNKESESSVSPEAAFSLSNAAEEVHGL